MFITLSACRYRTGGRGFGMIEERGIFDGEKVGRGTSEEAVVFSG
jgi:hypothetical protein